MAKTFQDTIVLFGDSITQEWAAGSLAHRFSAAYSRRLDVLNRGFGGYTSEWNRPIFEWTFAKQSEQAGLPAVRLVTLWLGANDATFPGRQQHLPLDKYISNMKHYLTSLLLPTSEYYQPHTYVLLLTPPPIVEIMRDEQKLQYPPSERTPADRSLSNTQLYRDALIGLAKEWKSEYAGKAAGERIGVVDTFGLIIQAAGGNAEDEARMRPYFTDGLHLTSLAYGVVFDECLRVAVHEFKGLDPEDQSSLKMTVPHWADVDPDHSRESIVKGHHSPTHDEL